MDNILVVLVAIAIVFNGTLQLIIFNKYVILLTYGSPTRTDRSY